MTSLHPPSTGPSAARRGLGPALVASSNVVLLALLFWGLALFSVRVVYRPVDVALLWLVYLLLAAFLVFATRSAAARHPALGWSARVAVVLVLLWHLREQTRRIESLVLLVALALLCGTALHFVIRRRAAASSARVVPAVATGAALCGVVVALYLAIPSQRWHLLRHNTLIGTPLYYLIARPVPEIAAELHGSAIDPPQDLVASPRSPSEPASVPSVASDLVVVLVDTLRADALAPWGGEREVMPATNRWLDGSHRFLDVVANSSWTRPSVASLFTGLRPEEHGARNVGEGIAPGILSFAEILGGLGYETAALVTNSGAAGSDAGFERGFELFHEFADEPYARAEKVNRAVTAFLERRQGDRPLLLYLHYLDPHEPYLAGDPPRRESAAAYSLAYRRELEYFDRHFQRLLEILGRHLDPASRLLLISDHGEELFEHGLFGHGHSLYQEVVHIPAALGGIDPAPVAAGADLDARLELRDFYDLILRLASTNGESPAAPSVARWAEERSRPQRFLSLHFTGSGRLWLRPYRRHNLMRAIDEPEGKLVWSAYGETLELYDLGSDPLELRNLAFSQRGRARRLKNALDDGHDVVVRPGPVAESSKARDQLRALGYID